MKHELIALSMVALIQVPALAMPVPQLRPMRQLQADSQPAPIEQAPAPAAQQQVILVPILIKPKTLKEKIAGIKDKVVSATKSSAHKINEGVKHVFHKAPVAQPLVESIKHKASDAGVKIRDVSDELTRNGTIRTANNGNILLQVFNNSCQASFWIAQFLQKHGTPVKLF